MISESARIQNSTYPESIKLFRNSVLNHSVYGVNVTIGDDTTIERSLIGNYVSIIRRNYINQTNEHAFLSLPLRYMSKLTHHLLKTIDYEAVREKRNKNYDELEKALGAFNSLKVNRPDGAFMYPFYCEDGMRIKRELAQRKIYVPTLWPNVLQMGKSLETEYAENIIPLPIDQRYNIENLSYVTENILSFFQ